MLSPDKDHPSPEWIDELRRRFPCEAEVDRILTRKMQRRGGPGYSPVALQTLIDGTRSLIGAHLAESFEISDAHWLAGGASKLQVAFSLNWNRPGVGRETTRMVLRMEPAESIVETSRLREYQLIKAFAGIVPVPPVFWVDPDGSHLPYPALICGFCPGTTKPSNSTSKTTGMGTYMAPEWRDRLGPQFVDCLARIHARDIASADLGAFDMPRPGTHAQELALNMWERIWEEDSDEDIPLLRVAAVWLRENAPPCAQPRILHCDYRVGNFLFTEHDAKITAILDWEMARIGDYHHDLAWSSAHSYGHYAEDGKTFLVGGFMPEPQFFDAYQRASGLTIDPKTLYYYKVYIGYVQGVISVSTTYRIARNGKNHQDVLQAWIMGYGYKMMDDLRVLLEQGV
jgi:aminoglycoside phosphotransferase (APT) family kinase protein